MMEKIHYIYIKICLAILKNVDPHKKLIGRPNKHEYIFYITHIIDIIVTGLSWDKLGSLLLINADLIRKKYIKWKQLGIFSKANNIILNQYKKKHKYKSLFIDSTNIANFSGCLDFGYNIKIKNKKSIKISVLIDHNKIPHIIDISKESVHDAKIMERIINTKLNNNKHIFNLVGDKGYIKNNNYIDNIKNNNNITLITPLRINSKRKNINDDEKNLLKDRIKVEHFFSLLKKGYKRISTINDKLLINYNNFLNIAVALISLNIINKL
jgi:hypothetical protein